MTANDVLRQQEIAVSNAINQKIETAIQSINQASETDAQNADKLKAEADKKKKAIEEINRLKAEQAKIMAMRAAQSAQMATNLGATTNVKPNAVGSGV